MMQSTLILIYETKLQKHHKKSKQTTKKKKYKHLTESGYIDIIHF